MPFTKKRFGPLQPITVLGVTITVKTKLETRTYNLCTKIEIDDTFDDKEGCKSL